MPKAKRDVSELKGRAINSLVLDIDLFNEIKVSVPTLDVQKEIVAELDGYQKIIDGAKQIVENWKPKVEIEKNWLYAKRAPPKRDSYRTNIRNKYSSIGS